MEHAPQSSKWRCQEGSCLFVCFLILGPGARAEIELTKLVVLDIQIIFKALIFDKITKGRIWIEKRNRKWVSARKKRSLQKTRDEKGWSSDAGRKARVQGSLKLTEEAVPGEGGGQLCQMPPISQLRWAVELIVWLSNVTLTRAPSGEYWAWKPVLRELKSEWEWRDWIQ